MEHYQLEYRGLFYLLNMPSCDQLPACVQVIKAGMFIVEIGPYCGYFVTLVKTFKAITFLPLNFLRITLVCSPTSKALFYPYSVTCYQLSITHEKPVTVAVHTRKKVTRPCPKKKICFRGGWGQQWFQPFYSSFDRTIKPDFCLLAKRAEL